MPKNSTDISYFIKQMEKKNGAHCADCLREVRYSLILSGELCLVVRDNSAVIAKEQCFHWMCVSDTALIKAIKKIKKQDILDDPLLSEDCKTRVVRAMENRKVEETQYNDNEFVSHHQMTLRYVNGIRDRVRGLFGKNTDSYKKTKKEVDEKEGEDLLKKMARLDLSK